MIKIEEVKLNSNNDLNSLNLQSEKISAEFDDLTKSKSVKVEEVNKKLGIKKSKQNLFFRILFFQFIVSVFVFLVLFSLKKFYPNKFNTISAQLNLAINDGPKFYEGLGYKIDEINKNFGLHGSFNKDKVFDRNYSSSDKKVKNTDTLELTNSNKNLNSQALAVKKSDDSDFLNFAVDNLENNSHEDDVFFLNSCRQLKME